VLAILPVSQIVPLDMAGGLHTADRFVYLPWCFAVLLLAPALVALAARLDARRGLGMAAAALAVVFAVHRMVFVLPHWNSAARFWERAYEMAPGSDVVLANLYEVRIKEERFDDAETIARALIAAYPGGGYGAHLSDAQLRRGAAHDAVETLSREIALRPTDVDLYAQRGWLMLQVQRFREAAEDYGRALALLEGGSSPKLRSKRPEVLAGAAAAALFEGQGLVEATRLADEAASLIETGDTRGTILLLWCQIALGRDEAARTSLERLPALAPIDLQQLITIGAMFAPDARIADALHRRAAASGIGEPQILTCRATGFARAQRFERAAGTFRDVVRLDPQAWDAQRALWGLVFDGRIEGGDVVALARRLTEIRPTSGVAWDDLGVSLFKADDVPGAEAALRKAVELDPEYADARFHHGMLLAQTARKEAGLVEIRKARELAVLAGRADLVRMVDAALSDLKE
jgi:Flp pilus assembly protein TadD